MADKSGGALETVLYPSDFSVLTPRAVPTGGCGSFPDVFVDPVAIPDYAPPLPSPLKPAGGCAAFPDITATPFQPLSEFVLALSPPTLLSNTGKFGWFRDFDKPPPPPTPIQEVIGTPIVPFNVEEVAGGGGGVSLGTLVIRLHPTTAFVPLPGKPNTVVGIPWLRDLDTGKAAAQVLPEFIQFVLAAKQVSPVWASVDPFPDLFVKPFIARDTPSTPYLSPVLNTEVNWQAISPDVFGKPFAAADQQFLTSPSRPVFTVFPDGWRSYQWDVQFKTPFTTPEMYLPLVSPLVTTGGTVSFPDITDNPFSASEQQFSSSWQIKLTTVPNNVTGAGWIVLNAEKIAKAYPAYEQQYNSTWFPVLSEPPVVPIVPGHGSRRRIGDEGGDEPIVRPTKPVRPVWDKGPQAPAPEPIPAAAPAIPPIVIPPLPPADVLSARMSGAVNEDDDKATGAVKWNDDEIALGLLLGK